MELNRICFIGLGSMGSPMARSLADGGFSVTVYNRTRGRAEQLAQATSVEIADTAASAAEGAEVIITMLSDADAVLDVYTSSDGVLRGLSGNAVAVDMGTTGSAGTERLQGLVEDAGGVLVDAPVLGSPSAAASRSLTVMAGGPTDAFRRTRPLFEAMASDVYHLGDTGAGMAMKLSVNTVIFGLVGALAEGLNLAERSGVDSRVAYQIFSGGAVGCPEVRDRAQNFLNPDAAPVTFALSLARKDLHLIAELAGNRGVHMPQAELNRQVMDAAVERGMGDRDMAALALYLQSAGRKSGENSRD